MTNQTKNPDKKVEGNPEAYHAASGEATNPDKSKIWRVLKDTVYRIP